MWIYKPFYFILCDRFDPAEPETDGVETDNHCKIDVDVAEIGEKSWTLKTKPEGMLS